LEPQLLVLRPLAQVLGQAFSQAPPPAWHWPVQGHRRARASEPWENLKQRPGIRKTWDSEGQPISTKTKESIIENMQNKEFSF
jgi:hypothetical protein